MSLDLHAIGKSLASKGEALALDVLKSNLPEDAAIAALADKLEQAADDAIAFPGGSWKAHLEEMGSDLALQAGRAVFIALAHSLIAQVRAAQVKAA